MEHILDPWRQKRQFRNTISIFQAMGEPFYLDLYQYDCLAQNIIEVGGDMRCMEFGIPLAQYRADGPVDFMKVVKIFD